MGDFQEPAISLFDLRRKRISLSRTDFECRLPRQVVNKRCFRQHDVEAHLESERRHHSPAALCGYSRVIVVKVLGRNMQQAAAGVFRSYAANGFRHPEQILHKVRVVDVQVQRHSSAALLVAEPVVDAPGRSRAEALECPGDNFSVLAGVDYFFGFSVLGPEPDAVPDLQDFSAAFGLGDHPGALFGV